MTSTTDATDENTPEVVVSTAPELTKPQTCGGCALLPQPRVVGRGDAEITPIFLLGDYPSIRSPRGCAPFQDRSGQTIGQALRQLRQSYHVAQDGVNRWKQLATYKTYAVQCTTDDKPPKAVVGKCRQHLESDIQLRQPKLIVAFGAQALQYLFKRKLRFDDVRGSFVIYKNGSLTPPIEIPVFVTFSPKAIMAQPGLYDELTRDLRKAFLFTEGREQFQPYTEEELREGYSFPRTVAEVRTVCQLIIDYRTEEGRDPATHLIAGDTETTTTEMHDPNAKVIAVSFAWDVGKATTILLDHPQSPWSPEERDAVAHEIRRVWACPKPKVFHNAKFDWQGIFHRYGWTIENLAWDTMCGEHLLEEDKKGEYGLKVLTRTRLPRYAGYEDKVAEIRAQHGGSTRAGEAKRFRKAAQKHAEASKDYARNMEIYNTAYAAHEKDLELWQAAYDAEKVNAKAEKRKIDKTKVAKKPSKPAKPRPPKLPERHQPFDYTMIPVGNLEFYAAIDADVTRQHTLHQNNRFNSEYAQDVETRKRTDEAYKGVKGYRPWPIPLPVKRLMRQHVLPLTKTLAQMEFTGFPVNLEYVEELDEALKKKISEHEQRLYDMAGAFNLNSARDVITVLFQKGFYEEKAAGIATIPPTDSIRKTTKGQVKTDEKALIYIANTFGYEFPKVLLQYRKACKARSPFLINVREHAIFDGRMHPQFHIAGTATGRTSSSDENMQNIPKKLAGYNIKKIFVPAPGNVLVNTDAKGAEVRIFAAYSQDAKLIEAILEGMDAHSFFTSKTTEYTYEQIEEARIIADVYSAAKSLRIPPVFNGQVITPEMASFADKLVRLRTGRKRVVFGVLYGAQAKKIAETAGISEEEAQEIINLMFRMFPSIPRYIQETEREVSLFHGVYTKTGRKRRFPIADLGMFRNRCFRQAVNFKIQSTSSDIVLWVLNQIAPIITNDMRGELHATVHDSIVFSTPPKYVSQAKDMMYEYGTKRVLEEFPWLPVPFLWDVEVGPSYGELSDVNKYLQGLQHDKEDSVPEEVITDEEVIAQFNEIANSA
jgi:uracil-DNA glycosylase family 4